MGLFGRRSAAPVDVDAIVSGIVEQVKAALPAAGVFDVLPRNDFGLGMPFSPGVPLTPAGIDPRESGTGRPSPRRSEFPVSVNMQINQQARLMPFSVLRNVAEGVDIIRRCVETRKSQMLAFDWDITLSRQAVKRVMLDNHMENPGEAAQVARVVLAEDIDRLRRFWERPDKINGMDWPTWLGVMLEEHLVTDALSIFPRRQLNGDVISFEILDGTTIKPLLDFRGATPLPPAPAFQQILYGFPRGEWTATADADSEWQISELIYRPRLRRTFTPYGLPDTESALSAADIYLKRIQWIREEFTEGATPDTWMIPPADSKMAPEQLRAWEAAINAENQAAMSERRKLRATPPGWGVKQMTDFADLYKPGLDELMIKILCSCFSVMPTEIGFPPGGGIGGKGHQEGESNSSHKRAIRPTATWIESVTTEISRLCLGMPDGLQFTLIGWETEDQVTGEEVANSVIRRGGMTLNEDRASKGLSMWRFPEADTPFLVTGAGVTFLPGAIAAQAAVSGPVGSVAPGVVPVVAVADTAPPVSPTNPVVDVPQDGDPIAADEVVPDGFIRVAGHIRRKPSRVALADEAAKFLRFAESRKGLLSRPFEFVVVPPGMAAAFNAAGATGDLATIRSMVTDLGKALPGV